MEIVITDPLTITSSTYLRYVAPNQNCSLLVTHEGGQQYTVGANTEILLDVTGDYSLQEVANREGCPCSGQAYIYDSIQQSDAGNCIFGPIENFILLGEDVDVEGLTAYFTTYQANGDTSSNGKSKLFRYDVSTDVWTLVHEDQFWYSFSPFVSRQFNAAAYDSQAKKVYFVYNSSNTSTGEFDELYIYDEVLDTVTNVGQVNYSTGAQNGVLMGAFDVTTGQYYIGDPSGDAAGQEKLFVVDTTTAVATEVAGFSFMGPLTQADMVFDADGSLYYTVNGEIYRVPTPIETSTHTKIGDFSFTKTTNLSIQGDSLFSLDEDTNALEERSKVDGSLINSTVISAIPNPEGFLATDLADATEGLVASSLDRCIQRSAKYCCDEDVTYCYWENGTSVTLTSEEIGLLKPIDGSCDLLPEPSKVIDVIPAVGEDAMFATWAFTEGVDPFRGNTGFGEILPDGTIVETYQEEPSVVSSGGVAIEQISFNAIAGDAENNIVYAFRRVFDSGGGSSELVTYDRNTSTYSVLGQVSIVGGGGTFLGSNASSGGFDPVTMKYYIYYPPDNSFYAIDPVALTATSSNANTTTISGGSGARDVRFLPDGTMQLMVDGNVYQWADANDTDPPTLIGSTETPASAEGAGFATYKGDNYFTIGIDIIQTPLDGGADVVTGTLVHPDAGEGYTEELGDFASMEVLVEEQEVIIWRGYCNDCGVITPQYFIEQPDGTLTSYTPQGAIEETQESPVIARVVSGSGTTATDSLDGQLFNGLVEDFTIVVLAGAVNVTLPSGDVFTMNAVSSQSFGEDTERDIDITGLSVVGTDGAANWRIVIDI